MLLRCWKNPKNAVSCINNCGGYDSSNYKYYVPLIFTNFMKAFYYVDAIRNLHRWQIVGKQPRRSHLKPWKMVLLTFMVQCNISTDLWYDPSSFKLRNALSRLGSTYAVALQRNCVRRTCSRSVRSSCLRRGSNPYSAHYRLSALTDRPPCHSTRHFINHSLVEDFTSHGNTENTVIETYLQLFFF